LRKYRNIAINWTVRTINDAVDAEIAALPDDIRRKLARLIGRMEVDGPGALSAKDAKHLEEKLWELRLIDRDGIARVIYVTISARRVVLLRAFVKKTQKTPLAELRIAKTRARSLD
jgi:phage-related protein